MRIVIDLQACQTEASHGRGVGRFTEALAAAMVEEPHGDEFRLTLNGNYAASGRALMDRLLGRLPRDRITAYRYPSAAARLPGTVNAWTDAAGALVRRHWLGLQPDVLHISHLFEGYVGEAVVPHPLPTVPGLVTSATLYDLIPLRFPDRYLSDPAFSRWYHGRLGTLRQCDHLLAISESTRADAIDLLNIAPERITTIGGGAGAVFRQLHPTPPGARGSSACSRTRSG
jgi:hypothetical protein